jgi:EAL domain-containing protein (putative c-di-GMP-specific phosphodiesterase class I)
VTGHVRGDARKRSLESQHRLKIEQGLIVSCMCGAATNTDPYGDAVTTHIIAEARADGANTVLEAVETYGDRAAIRAAREAAAAIRGVR